MNSSSSSIHSFSPTWKLWRNKYSLHNGQNKLLTNAKPLNEKQMQLAAKALLSENAGLVNMHQLFGYLVDYVGGEQMLDPQTKQDSLWQIVDLFTRDPRFYSVSQMSQNDTLQPE